MCTPDAQNKLDGSGTAIKTPVQGFMSSNLGWDKKNIEHGHFVVQSVTINVEHLPIYILLIPTRSSQTKTTNVA